MTLKKQLAQKEQILLDKDKQVSNGCSGRDIPELRTYGHLCLYQMPHLYIITPDM